MKVLHLIKTSTGASWALRQLKVLVKEGVDVYAVMPEGPRCEEYKNVGVKVIKFQPGISLSKPFSNFSTVRKLRACVRDIKPDIICSYFVNTTLLMRLGLRGFKDILRVFQVPGPLHLEYSLYRRMELLLAQKNDYWMGTCKWTVQKYLESGIPEQRVGLTYFGVEESQFIDENKKSPANLRKHLGLLDSDFLIAMVAYFYAPKKYLGHKRGIKGHEDLIDAMAIVGEKFPHAKCIFVGGPWGKADKYFRSVKKYAEKVSPNNCYFVGYRGDVPAIYKEVSLAIHPSHSENVGGAVESLYSKVPTIATNIGGFPDAILPNITGYLVNSKSPRELANMIMYVINNYDEAEKTAVNGLQHIRQLMNVETNAKEVLEFYNKILNAKTLST